ncbi:retrotransposable element Tf2 [Tanacetum coccineum]
MVAKMVANPGNKDIVTQIKTAVDAAQAYDEAVRLMCSAKARASFTVHAEGSRSTSSKLLAKAFATGNMLFRENIQVDHGYPKHIDPDHGRWRERRCQQFFKVDEVAEDQKVRLVSIHLFDKDLAWHRQLMKIHGEIVEWSLYESEILKRFGACYEDPMEELKNLKQDGSVANYQDQFKVLLGKVELSDQYAISLFLGGLQTDIGLVVKMFKPKSLYDAYHLARMQEASKAAFAKRYTPILDTPKTQFNKPSYPKTQTTLPLPATSSTKMVTTNTETPRRQLSRKEYEEKRATNLCFYYDQKYTPGHKCTGQDIVYNVEEDRIQPHISLNALAEDWVVELRKLTLLQVDVPGGIVISACECKDFIWSLQGMEFKTDAMLLPLGGCEMKERSRKMACNVAELASLSLCVYPVSLVTATAEEHEVPTTLPPHREQDHRIVLQEGTHPVNVRPYKHPPPQKNAIELMLNKHNVKDKFPMPVIEEFINELHGAIIFNKLDLRIGKVAYKLQLPNHVKVHPVFYVSKLKKCRSKAINMGTFPVCNDNGLLAVEPQAVLDMRMQKKNNKVAVYLLIRWVNGTKDDATWEPAKEFIKRFPDFSLDT